MMNKVFYVICMVLLATCKGEDGVMGPSGLNSLISTMQEPPGDSCSLGGLKVETGLDSNSNGVLDADEVTKTDFICGAAGVSDLINVVDDPAGATCAFGGVKIESGIDDNSNGILDNEEIQTTRYICNGDNGLPHEVRFDFNLGGTWETTSSKILGGESASSGIYNFKYQNFANADSVYLGGLLTSLSAGTVCTLQLYDLTNGTVIANSAVSTTSTSQV